MISSVENNNEKKDQREICHENDLLPLVEEMPMYFLCTTLFFTCFIVRLFNRKQKQKQLMGTNDFFGILFNRQKPTKN